MEVVVGMGSQRRVLGEADAALRERWSTKAAWETWVVGKQIEPGLWTSAAAGARDARTEFVTLQPWSLDDTPDRLPPRGGKRSEPVATLVPGLPGSLALPAAQPLIFTRDDGALNIHPHQPGPANCCDGRMVYIFVNRNGVTRCPSCDGRGQP